MGKKKFLNKNLINKEKSRFIINEPEDYNQMVPLFSLERVQSGAHCFSQLDRDDKSAFADSIFKRRSLTWNDIQQNGRHQLGYEKIKTTAIKVTVPKFITEDSHNLIAFRYNGKRAMVGYRIKNIFYVLWFDHSFSLYDH